MRVDHDGVASGDHAHGVAGDRGERVGDRRDRADHAEGGVLDDGQAMVTAKHLAPHEFHAGRPLAEHLELFDLVFQPADLRLDKFHAAEFLGVVDRDPSDVVDRLAPAFHAQPLELLERGLNIREVFGFEGLAALLNVAPYLVDLVFGQVALELLKRAFGRVDEAVGLVLQVSELALVPVDGLERFCFVDELRDLVI